MPAAATAAAKAAITVVKSRRGRRLLLALFAGLALSLALVVIVLLSSVSAVIGVCRTEASQAQASGPSGNSESLGLSPNSPGSPTFVSQNWSEAALSDVPQEILSLYEKAGKDYGLDAAVIAAVGKKETDHGRSDLPSVKSGENSAGAGGPMQFLASTWANVGVDGNDDGTMDRYDPEDAIPGAANYLKLEGAPQDYNTALLAYNHSQSYVDGVLAQADEYRGSGGGTGGEGEYEQIAGREPSDGSSVGPPDRPSTGLATLLSPLATRPAHAQGASGTVGSPGETDYSSAEIETLNLINDYREENGLGTLELSDMISTASAHYAHDMAKYDAYRNPEAHVSGPTDYYFEGAVLTDRMNAEGYHGSSVR